MRKGDKRIFSNRLLLQKMLTYRSKGLSYASLERIFNCDRSSIRYQCIRHEVYPETEIANGRRPSSYKPKKIRIIIKKAINRKTDQEIIDEVNKFKSVLVDERGERMYNKNYKELLMEAEARSNQLKI